MEREALKLALEALELVNIEFVCNGAHHAKKDRHELGDDCPVTARYQNAITAIKAALAQPTQEPVAWAIYDKRGGSKSLHWTENHWPDGDATKFDAVPLYTAPPQREWNAALDHAAARIGEIKGFGQATQDSFAVFIQGLKR